MVPTLSLLPQGAAAQTRSVVRYLCELPDGSTRSFVRNLAADFGASIGTCRATTVDVVDDPPAGRDDVLANAILSVRTIDAPDARRPAAAHAVAHAVDSPAAATSERREQAVLLPLDAQWLVAASRLHGIDPALVSAVMYVESRYRRDARSSKGAIGLMQIMPSTGLRYGIPSIELLAEPKTNIAVGVRYLRDLVAMFPGRLDLAVAAYNAGEGAVRKHGNQVPPYHETRLYVEEVLQRFGRRSLPF